MKRALTSKVPCGYEHSRQTRDSPLFCALHANYKYDGTRGRADGQAIKC